MIRCWLFGHNYVPVKKFLCFLVNGKDEIIGLSTSHQGYECARCGKRHVVEFEAAGQVRDTAFLWQSRLPFDDSFQREAKAWFDDTQETAVDSPEPEPKRPEGLRLVVDK